MKNYSTTSEFKLSDEEKALIEAIRKEQEAKQKSEAERLLKSYKDSLERSKIRADEEYARIEIAKALFIESGIDKSEIEINSRKVPAYLFDESKYKIQKVLNIELNDFYYDHSMKVCGYYITLGSTGTKAEVWGLTNSRRYIKIETIAKKILTIREQEEKNKEWAKYERRVAYERFDLLKGSAGVSYAEIEYRKEHWTYNAYINKSTRVPGAYHITLLYKDESSLELKLTIGESKEGGVLVPIVHTMLVKKLDAKTKDLKTADDWMTYFGNR